MAGLLRYQIFSSYGILLLGVWYAAIQNKASILSSTSTRSTIPIVSTLLTPKIQEAMIDYFPLWIVICFGLYAVGSIASGVANCADCPDAAMEVEQHIKEAKADMKKRGIID